MRQSSTTAANITNWFNEVSNDTVYANVEYRARNIGGQDIAAYELYFRIDAGGASFYEEVKGEELGVNQTGISGFPRRIETNVEADSVTIDDYYFEGQH